MSYSVRKSILHLRSCIQVARFFDARPLESCYETIKQLTVSSLPQLEHKTHPSANYIVSVFCLCRGLDLIFCIQKSSFLLSPLVQSPLKPCLHPQLTWCIEHSSTYSLVPTVQRFLLAKRSAVLNPAFPLLRETSCNQISVQGIVYLLL